MHAHTHLIQHHTAQVLHYTTKRVTLTGLNLFGATSTIKTKKYKDSLLLVTTRLWEQHVNQTGQKQDMIKEMFGADHTVIIAKMIITLIYLNDELLSQRNLTRCWCPSTDVRDASVNWRWVREEPR